MFIYKYLQDVLVTLCFTFQLRDLFSAHTPLVSYPFYTTLLCSNFSSQKPFVHSILTSQVRNPMYTLFSLLKSETQCTLYSHFLSQKPNVHSVLCIGMLCLIKANLTARL